MGNSKNSTTIKIIKRKQGFLKKLDKKTHNKAIQKGIESFRLTKEQKDYLKSLKINLKIETDAEKNKNKLKSKN